MNIDTVRKALILANEYVGTERGMMTRQEAKLQIALRDALAELATSDSTAKHTEFPEEVVQKILNMSREDQDYILSIAADKYAESTPGMSLALDIRNELTLDESVAAIVADREAVRRECADRADAWLIEYRNANDLQTPDDWINKSLRSAIMNTETEKDTP